MVENAPNLANFAIKTISQSDFVEDKKHIDLSSEPLILVCAAGTRNTVIGDIIKDTAIFKAHKATPIVIADQGENRFRPYADTVFQCTPGQRTFRSHSKYPGGPHMGVLCSSGHQ